MRGWGQSEGGGGSAGKSENRFFKSKTVFGVFVFLCFFCFSV